MKDSPPGVKTYSDADIDAILADLTAHVPEQHQLRAWASECGIPVKRVVATPDLTYVRLAGKDETGGYVVLMLLDGMWERVF
ncbi:arsenate reductase-like glutaredoxin family protein [Agrococcus sp. UYP10]|uniref:hypothetical protein n=1 Tax=Agrococcus sp. UYP10 TaxID=1756355 RepID=UPI003393638A